MNYANASKHLSQRSSWRLFKVVYLIVAIILYFVFINAGMARIEACRMDSIAPTGGIAERAYNRGLANGSIRPCNPDEDAQQEYILMALEPIGFVLLYFIIKRTVVYIGYGSKSLT